MKKGTHGYTICECKKRAWGIHANGRCTSCITASELYNIVYPPKDEKAPPCPKKERRKKNRENKARKAAGCE